VPDLKRQDIQNIAPGRINPGGWGTLVEILTRLPMNYSDWFEAVARCDTTETVFDQEMWLV
jgi:hypothetical protein